MAPDAQPVQVDLSIEMQTRIRDFARNLASQDYYEVLGVEREVGAEAVREAFFERTKVFHPDRYFRKELGPFRELLTEIYKRVVVAHEVLKDDKLRSAYDKRLAEIYGKKEAPLVDDSPPSASTAAPAPAGPKPGAPPGIGPSLRARKGLRTASSLVRLEQQIKLGRQKASSHFKSALRERDGGDVVRAVSFIRLAMVFDPRKTEYHDVLAELLPRANAVAAERLRRQAEPMLRHGKFEDAIRLLEEAFDLKPTSADDAFEVVLLARDRVGDPEKARLFAAHAVRLDDKNSVFRKAHALLLKQAGQEDEARREFQRAWELDPLDKEVMAELGRS